MDGYKDVLILLSGYDHLIGVVFLSPETTLSECLNSSQRQCPFAKHMNQGGDACNVAMWNPFLNLTSPVTKVTALSSLETKNVPQQKRGDDSSITFATIGWFTNNLCYHWVISTASQVRPVKATPWIPRRQKVRGLERNPWESNLFPTSWNQAMKPWIGWYLGCKMIVLPSHLHPIMVDKCRNVVYE